MRILPWVKMPALWIKGGGLRDFGWASTSTVQRSKAIAALQLYIALLTVAEEDWRTDGCKMVADITYSDLMRITNLSRQLVAAGLEGLAAAGRITSEKQGSGCRADGWLDL